MEPLATDLNVQVIELLHPCRMISTDLGWRGEDRSEGRSKDPSTSMTGAPWRRGQVHCVLQTCYICEEQGRESKAASGACMTCNRHGCRQAFHVTW
jgi:hypothetical protein